MPTRGGMTPKEELQSYIKETRAAGFQDSDIRMHLKAVGWSEREIEEALKEPAAIDSVSLPPTDTTTSAPGAVIMGELEPRARIPKKWLRPVLIAGGILIIGGASYAAYARWNNEPVRVLAQMKERFTKAASYHYDARVNFTFGADPNASASLFTDAVKNFPQRISGESIFKGVVAFDPEGTPEKANTAMHMTVAYEDVSVKIGMEVRTIGRKSYIQFTEFPLLYAAMPQLRDQWISISEEDVKNLQNNPALKPYMTSPEDLEKSLKDNEEFTRKLKEIWKNVRWYTFRERLADDRIRDTATFHYQADIDKKALSEGIAQSLALVLSNEELKNLAEQGALQLNAQKIRESFEKYFSFRPVDLYIGKRDRLPYRILGGVGIAYEKAATLDLTGSLEYYDYNKPVQVEVPSNVMALSDFVNAMLKGINNATLSEQLPSLTLYMIQQFDQTKKVYVLKENDAAISQMRATLRTQGGELVVCMKTRTGVQCDTTGRARLEGSDFALYGRPTAQDTWTCVDRNTMKEGIAQFGEVPCK